MKVALRSVWGAFASATFATAAFAEVPRAVAVSPARSGHCENPVWSRDGRSLAYERVFLEDRKIEVDILSSVFAQKKERTVKLPRLDGADAAASRTAARFRKRGAQPLARGDVCREFTWGPKTDPDVFAHACNVRGGTFQLFWSEGARLTDGPGSAGQPALSPVGWRLAFVSGTKGREGLALVDDLVESTASRPLARTAGRIDRMPVWDPSGTALAFIGHTDRGADLYIIRSVGRPDQKVIRLTDWPEDELNPSWSPDGRRIAFFARRGRAPGRRPAYHLYVVAANGASPPVQVAKDVVVPEKKGPAWTPDGEHLVFVKNLQEGKIVDPLRAVPARSGAAEIKLETKTVSNQDPTIVAVGGRSWLAYTSLGYADANRLAWRRVFAYPLDALSATRIIRP